IRWHCLLHPVQWENHPVAFSPDGAMLFSSQQYQGIYLWDARTGQRFTTIHTDTQPPKFETLPGGRYPAGSHAPPVYARSLAVSPDGTLLASLRFNRLDVWDLTATDEAGHVRKAFASEFQPTQCPLAVAFSRDGRTLAAAGWGKSIRLWQVAPSQGSK